MPYRRPLRQDSPVQVLYSFLQSVSSIFFPAHSVYSRRRPLLQALVAAVEQFGRDMVQQGRELYLRLLLCYLPHTVQPAWLAFPALSSGTS